MAHFELIEKLAPNAVIKVIGVGGGGGNAVAHMVNAGVEGVEFITANTDAQAIKQCGAKLQLQLGGNVTKGLGAGANPEVGRQAALEDRERIVEALEGAQSAQPALPRGLLLDAPATGWIETALRLECVAIVCNHVLWDTSTVTQARSAGFRCLSYTVNDAWAAQRLLELGTDGIITDRIDLFPPA